MARKTIEVDKELLQQTIKRLEGSNVFSTQNELWVSTAEQYNKNKATKLPNISSGVVYLRVKQLDISIQTKKGKKGGIGNLNRPKKTTPRKEKFKRHKEVFEEMRSCLKRDGVYQRFYKLVDKIEKGSMVAAVKLHCYQCVAYQTNEMKSCELKTCPLWIFTVGKNKEV